MANTDIKDPEEIYNLAIKCDDLFSSYLSSGNNHDRAVEGRQQQFWAWATGLGVFAEPALSLDRKLRGHVDVQELVIRLLDVLNTGLCSLQALGLGGTSNFSDAKTVRAIQAEKKSVDTGSVQRQDALYGLDGALERLNRLSVIIRRSSKGSLNRKVIAYAAKHEIYNAEFENKIRTILTFLFPAINEGLLEQLLKSIAYRHNRLLYERGHQTKIQREREPWHAPTPSPNTSKAGLMSDRIEERHRSIGQGTGTEPKSGRSTLDKQVFNTANREPSPTDSEVGSIRSVSSAAWTGGIEYPHPPKSHPVGGYVECYICLRKYEPKKLQGQRKWQRHVDEDVEPYVSISEECDNPPLNFPKYRSWLKHMEEVHTQNWLGHLHNTKTWVCVISHSKPQTFDKIETLHQHISDCHPEEFNQYGSKISSITERSQIPILRNPEICPICQCPVHLLPMDMRNASDAGAISSLESYADNTVNEMDQVMKAKKMSHHIASHLKSLAFKSLTGITDGVDEVGRDEDSYKASNGQANDNESEPNFGSRSSLDNISLSSYDIPPDERDEFDSKESVEELLELNRQEAMRHQERVSKFPYDPIDALNWADFRKPASDNHDEVLERFRIYQLPSKVDWDSDPSSMASSETSNKRLASLDTTRAQPTQLILDFQRRHWAEKIFDDELSSLTRLRHRRASKCFGPPMMGIRLGIVPGSTVLFKLPFDKNRVSLTVYIQPDGSDMTRFLCRWVDQDSNPLYSCYGVHELSIRRVGSSLMFSRLNHNKIAPPLWMCLFFETWEKMVLLHSTFGALKSRCPLTLGITSNDVTLGGEKRLFQGKIIDDNFEHILTVVQDERCHGVRLHAAVRNDELRRCPVWTAFITSQFQRPDWMERRSRHRIWLKDIYPFVFCNEYKKKHQIRKRGEFEIYFINQEAADAFEEIFREESETGSCHDLPVYSSR